MKRPVDVSAPVDEVQAVRGGASWHTKVVLRCGRDVWIRCRPIRANPRTLTSKAGMLRSAREYRARWLRPTRLHDRSREPEQTVRRPHGGPGRLLHGVPGRDPGLPRTERCRQDHHAARDHRLSPRHLRHRPGVWLRRLRAIGRSAPPDRVPAREPSALRRHDGGALPALHRQDSRSCARGRGSRGRPCDRHLRARRRLRTPPGTSLEGISSARGSGAGADPRTRGAHPRRTDQRARPGPDPRHAGVHPFPRRQAHDRALHAHPVPGAHRLPQGRDHQRRTCGGRGAPWGSDTRSLAGRRVHAGDLGRPGEPAGLMRNTLTIAGRELRSYFSSPVAYVLIAVFLALAGYFFYALLTAFNQTLAIYSMMRNPQMLQRFNLNEMVLRPLLHNMSVLLIFILPAITMRMFPEEKRAGTYELLLTSPVRIGEIVAGKFLGGLALVAIMVALSGVFGLLLSHFGNPELPMMLSGYLGLFLVATAFLAIGTLLSSFTDNVVIAYVGTLFALLVLYTIGWLGEAIQGAWAAIVRYVSITEHFQLFTQGIIDTKALVYFATILIVSLFLTHRSVESVRWR